VEILQSEVSANDLANATLINDLIAAREAQFRELQRIGVAGRSALAVLRPLDLQIARYRFAPIRVIEPAAEISGTLEFDPAKIQAGIAAGRRAVEQHWESIEPLLS
jgi:NTE family protein